MTRFDEYDLEVYKAHSIAEWEGAAFFKGMRHAHVGPLPIQRLQGMARRGLLRYEGEDGTWCLTPEGVELAHALRDSLTTAAEPEQGPTE